ncbi:MAG: discoidin domain-containing protein [bacterium]
MGNKTPLFLLAPLALAAAPLALAAPAKVITEDGVTVEVSSSPNPAWTADKLLDGKLGPADGWLTLIGNENPWVRFSFPGKREITAMVFYQISFEKAGLKRYARPRTLEISLDGAPPRTLALKDLEGKPQVWRFTPLKTSTVQIAVADTYADARYPEYTGFQEISFVPVDRTVPSDAEPVDAPPGDQPGARPQTTPEYSPAGNPPGDNPPDPYPLDNDEKELLRLLRELTEKLEKYIEKKSGNRPAED